MARSTLLAITSSNRVGPERLRDLHLELKTMKKKP